MNRPSTTTDKQVSGPLVEIECVHGTSVLLVAKAGRGAKNGKKFSYIVGEKWMVCKFLPSYVTSA